MNERVEIELRWVEEHMRRLRYQADILSLELGDRGILLKHVYEAYQGLEHEVKALREELSLKKDEVEEIISEEVKDESKEN